MNSTQTILHLLKNDIRRQGWLFRSWVILGCAFIAIIFYLGLTISATPGDVGRGATSNAVITVIFAGSFLWMYVAAPLILGMNILSADPPSGSDRFWMTRPVSGKVLFLEKLFLVLFIIGFHAALLYCITNLDGNNKGFFKTYALLIPLFGALVAQLTILPRKFISVLCLVIFVFLTTKFYDSTIFYRINLLAEEPIQISAIPTILAFVIPFLFLVIGIGNQYLTRRTKRSVALFALSALVTIGVTENSSVPLEFLEIKEAIPCKGIIESTGEEFNFDYTTGHTKKERHFPGNIVYFNMPKTGANCYWSSHATKNPNTQIWGDWIYQNSQFYPHYQDSGNQFPPRIPSGMSNSAAGMTYHHQISNGAWNTLNEDLKNPSWLNHEKFMKGIFSQKAVFVSGKKEKKLPLQIFLKEKKLTRVAEVPLEKDNYIFFSRDGRVSFKNPFWDEPFIHFNNGLEGGFQSGGGSLPSNFLVILYNPLRNEAIRYGDSLWANNEQLPKDARFFRLEWRKNAQIIVYHISDTGRTGLATLENPTK